MSFPKFSPLLILLVCLVGNAATKDDSTPSKFLILIFLNCGSHCGQISSGLYYKHMMIVNYASGIINKLEALLTDDARVVIYDRHAFIAQATSDQTFDHLNKFVVRLIIFVPKGSNFRWSLGGT